LDFTRHTHATLLLESGINIKVVSELLGHADTTTTSEIYTHVTPKMKGQVIDLIEKMQNGGQTEDKEENLSS